MLVNKYDKNLVWGTVGLFINLPLAIFLSNFPDLGIMRLIICLISILTCFVISIIDLNKVTKLNELKGSLDQINGTWEHPPSYWVVLAKLNEFERRKQSFRGFGTVNKRSRYV